jgi:outer membrane murein-binding lipoprotein Lpp
MKKIFLVAVLLSSPLLAGETSDQKEIITRLDALQKDIQDLRKQVEILTSVQQKKGAATAEPNPEDIAKAIKATSLQYEIARKVGPSKDSCFLAKNIASFALKYSRANDYTQWKPIANEDCKAAGWLVD